jgi:protein-disulfide isomerase
MIIGSGSKRNWMADPVFQRPPVRRAVLPLLALLTLGGAVLAQKNTEPQRPAHKPAGRGPALDKSALETYLRRLELWPTQVNVRVDDPKPFITGLYEVNVHLSAGAATKDVIYYVSEDGQKVLRGTAHDMRRSPFQADLDLIKTSNAPSFGPANAPLTLVVYSDFECPLCREEAKSLREHLPKEFPGEVRAVFKNFPLETIHPWAKSAAIAGRCVFQQNGAAFWDFHDWIYDKQGEINGENLRSKVLDWSKTKGLDALGLTHCIDTRATEGEVNTEITESKALNVDATPTAFLNGRRLVGQIPWDNMAAIIKLEMQFAAANERK